MEKLGEKPKKVADDLIKRNVAAKIKTEIREWLYNKPNIAMKRWLFELLQNAIDTAKQKQKNTKIEVTFGKEGGKKCIIFKHNAGAFSLEEIDAIIYGGTTKIEAFAPEQKYIGRFGSGFLVTHKLNRKVRIEGIVEDENKTNYRFKIFIDRTSDNEKEIVSNIDKCFDQLADAISVETVDDEYHAEFRYVLKDSESEESAKVGIDILENLTPFILAFNQELSEIMINNRSYIKREEEKDSNLSKVLIESTGEKCLNEILLCTDSDIMVSVMLRNNEIIKIADDIPRLFVCMPLIGTEKIPIPFIINSFALEPSENRDAVYMEGDSKFTVGNKEILETAFNCFYEMMKFCVKNRFKNLYHLSCFSNIPLEYFADKKDFRKFWEEHIKDAVEELLEFEIVEIEGGYKKPSETIFPVPMVEDTPYGRELSREQFDTFHELATELKKLPEKDIAYEWQRIVRNWKEIDGNLDLNFYSVESLR